jgi:hypothetical protein
VINLWAFHRTVFLRNGFDSVRLQQLFFEMYPQLIFVVGVRTRRVACYWGGSRLPSCYSWDGSRPPRCALAIANRPQQLYTYPSQQQLNRHFSKPNIRSVAAQPASHYW